jgi:hypothetical protein
MKKIIYIALIVILISAFFKVFAGFHKRQITSDLSGTWSISSTTCEFNIKLYQNGNSLYGTHCSVMENGNRIDCVDDDDYSITGTITDPNQVSINFHSYSSETDGEATIKRLTDTTLEWKITKKPTGEFYIPDSIVLNKE